MKNKTLPFILMTIAGFIANPVAAGIITVDPDSFAAGTILNNSYSGVTLSAFGTSTDGNVYSRTSGLATTGTRVFGNSSGFDPLWIPGGRTMRVDFAVATNFASLDFIANDTTDTGQLSWFNAANILLGSSTTAALNANQFQTLSASEGSNVIAYITATGFGGDNLALDNLRYSVPEPESIALLGLGLAGLVLSRRKRTKHVAL